MIHIWEKENKIIKISFVHLMERMSIIQPNLSQNSEGSEDCKYG